MGRFDSFAAPLPGISEPAVALSVGTAGHVDHGKTALVAALTGVDTDRLPEEKSRGMSIALGYAPLRLPDGRALSLIDVPGHERLIRVMVSGAGGIDLFLLVIAADDGVMPQTLEHVRVLQALGVRHGVVAVTKSDLADPGPATAAASDLLPGIEVAACSARTGAGITDVAAAIGRAAQRTPVRAGGQGSPSFTSTGCSPSPARARWSPGRFGPDASPAAIGSLCNHRIERCGSERCRSMTAASRSRLPDSVWPSISPVSIGARWLGAMRSSVSSLRSTRPTGLWPGWS